jgi:hypothetical protein
MEPLLVSGVSCNRFVSGRLVWLREALVTVVCAAVGHLPLEMLIALALSIAAVFVICAGVARAEAPRLVPDGQFESAGAVGVAVDQSASESDLSRGDVYVAGYLFVKEHPEQEVVRGRVNKFDASGNVLNPPPPIGEAFAYSGAAVNPVNGDVYALDAIGSQVDTYDPTSGALLGSLSVPPSDNFTFFGQPIVTMVGIAADSAGNVYVPVVTGNEVREYSPAGEPLREPLKTFTGGGVLKGPTGVSVDPAGNVWVADAGNDRIVELSSADTLVREIVSEGVQSVAVDAHGDVFATVKNSADFCGKIRQPCSHLLEYSSAGTQVADIGAGSIGAEAAEQQREAQCSECILPDMVAVSDATGRVYVSEGVTEPHEVLHSRVFKFTPPVAPKLEGEVAVEVGVSKAKLGAVVNPGGISAAYRFEYGTTAGYGNTVPFPEGDTGGGFHSRSVWASASGLLPGVTYHYRVVVTGDLGEPVVGKDQTFTTETAARAACPNEQLRTGFSASLPDCRAYELVTPPNKTSAEPDPPEGSLGGNIEGSLLGNLAAVDGNRFSFTAEDVFPGSKSAGIDNPYVATRGASGWSSESVGVPKNYYGYECGAPKPGYSADLSKGIMVVGGGGECGGPEPELVSGEPKGVINVFVRDNTNGSYQLVNLTPPGVTPANAETLSASADFSRVVFREQARLTENALGGVANVYQWSGGVVHLVTVLADGTPVAGSFAGSSRDASRVFFTYAGKLYARVNGASTVQVDASQAGGGGGGFLAASPDGSRVLFSADASAGLTGNTTPGSGNNLYSYDFASDRLSHLDASQAGGTGGGGSFITLSADGSQVLFSDEAPSTGPGLTSDTTPGSGNNLYGYEFASGRLIDLTSGAHAELLGVFGVAEDGSYVYFEAEGALAAGATQGQRNRYVWHAGTTTFLAALANLDLGPAPPAAAPKLSKSGRFLAFASPQSLTGYDNTDANTGKPDGEIYLYDAASNSLVCASCNPSGAPPTGGPRWGSGQNLNPRNLSEDGRVFFDTSEALLPADTNGQRDVYEFEPDGVGSCSDPGGCVSLISTGTGGQETWFIEASPSGNDVFLREYQKLVPQDKQEEARTIYDVRVNGGIPEPPTPPECTTADACRTALAPQPSIFGAPASQTFSGAGSLVPPLTTVKPPAKPKKCKRGVRHACKKKKHRAKKGSVRKHRVKK